MIQTPGEGKSAAQGQGSRSLAVASRKGKACGSVSAVGIASAAVWAEGGFGTMGSWLPAPSGVGVERGAVRCLAGPVLWIQVQEVQGFRNWAAESAPKRHIW